MPEPPITLKRGGASAPEIFDQVWLDAMNRKHRIDGPAWILTIQTGMILRWVFKGIEVMEVHTDHARLGREPYVCESSLLEKVYA